MLGFRRKTLSFVILLEQQRRETSCRPLHFQSVEPFEVTNFKSLVFLFVNLKFVDDVIQKSIL